MIKKLLDYLPGNKRKKALPSQPKLNIIPRSEHHVSRNDISDHALKVLYRLNKAGHEAYLVGGGVRDLLLHKHPKDFDIATSASPEEVHNLFRNSRLIGRRFKLVHVLFGREIIEVATFRGQHKEDDKHSASSEEGMILRDNVYGTKEEDALRRDFTVNALYYCVKDFSIHDYANGLEDLNKKQLRLIGDPDTRYREDPVRMLRAVRFATKLDFDLEPSTAKPITELADLLAHIPSARLFEEVLKLFMSGHALENFLMLRELGLFKHLFPDADACLNQNNERDYRFIEIALKNTDIRIKQDKPVTPAFLYSAFLWLPLQDEWQRSQKAGNSAFPALHMAANKVIDRQTRSTSIPKRFGIPMKEIWEMQLRLPKRQGKRAEQIASHPRFRASYDFLLLREQSGENLDGLGQWWTDYQKSDAHSKRKLIKDTVPNGPRKRSRSRSGPRKKPGQKPNQ